MGEVKREQECNTADDWRHRAYHLESEWARCSQACAVMQGERDALAAEKADCEKFLKEGERLDECLERWRADALAVLELLAQERVKSEALAAEVAQSDADYQDAVTLAQMNKDRLDVAEAEVAKLKAACAAKDAALRSARELLHSSEWPSLCNNIDTALSDTAGKGWIDASGVVEGYVVERSYGQYADVQVPDDWAGCKVKIVQVKP